MLRVRDGMTREVLTAGPETSVAEAVAICEEKEIRHLPVVESGRLIGVVSDRDLRSVADEPQSGGESDGLKEIKVNRRNDSGGGHGRSAGHPGSRYTAAPR